MSTRPTKAKEFKFTWIGEEDKEAIQKAFEIIMKGENDESSAIRPCELR